MRETFAEYRAKQTVEKKNNEMLRTQSAPEWERVRGAVAALNGTEGLDGRSFQWMGSLSALTLQDVCASVPRGRQLTTEIRGFTIRFNQRPASPGETYLDDSSIAPETWTVTPTIDSDHFVWEIKDESGARAAPPGLNSDEVADEVAKGLAQYFIKYEGANGRQW